MGVRYGGRQKGTPNKFTADVKAALHAAFEELGGVKYLVKLGKSDPQIFCALLGKTLPKEITGADGGPIQVAASLHVYRIPDNGRRVASAKK